MNKQRLEAFSDGVIAILITIMVLELRVPHIPKFDALIAVVPTFLSYVLSFVYLGIYWNNHHHMLQAARHVTGGVLWANLHLLFWLSLLPFATAWMGENHYAAAPTALYGVILLACAFVAIPLAFVNQYWSDALFVVVALLWVVPDPRIERRLKTGGTNDEG